MSISLHHIPAIDGICADKHDNPHIQELLARMHAMHPRLIDLSLQRMTRLLDALGNPHHKLSRPIHIAGTNGKGSTYAFLRACLKKKYRTINGYTSPHLTRFNERIMLHNHDVDDKRLATALSDCIDANAHHPITFFEITTAAAFLLFHLYPADITLIECGMGGRFDATNVIKNPIATIITSISLDHQRYLGKTLAKIAREKAGIMKTGTPCIIGKQYPKIRQQLERYAQQHLVPHYTWGTAWHHDHDKKDRTPWAYHGHYHGKKHLHPPTPSLKGYHQYDNAALAIACIETLAQTEQDLHTMVDGIKDATWHGRLQPIQSTSPLMISLPNTTTLWLDGGHNHAAARALNNSLDTLSGGKKWALVFGMLQTKDPCAFIKALRPHIASIYTVPVIGEGTQARDSHSLTETLRPILDHDIPIRTCSSLHDALEKLGTDTGKPISTHATSPHSAPLHATASHPAPSHPAPSHPSYALICGSLYLVGEALTINKKGMPPLSHAPNCA